MKKESHDHLNRHKKAFDNIQHLVRKTKQNKTLNKLQQTETEGNLTKEYL